MWDNSLEMRVVEKLIRNIYYIAKKQLPLSHFSELRSLQALNGTSELSVREGEGIFSDPSCNYNSPPMVREFLQALSDELRATICKDILQSDNLGFMADESVDAGGRAVLLMYIRWLDANGLPEETFLGLVFLSLRAPEQLEEFLGNIGSETKLKSSDYTMKGQIHILF